MNFTSNKGGKLCNSCIILLLLKDIEEKAPLLQQQRKDYEGALITIDKLTLKLEDAMKVRVV